MDDLQRNIGETNGVKVFVNFMELLVDEELCELAIKCLVSNKHTLILVYLHK